jgi:hypothetical protein
MLIFKGASLYGLWARRPATLAFSRVTVRCGRPFTRLRSRRRCAYFRAVECTFLRADRADERRRGKVDAVQNANLTAHRTVKGAASFCTREGPGEGDNDAILIYDLARGHTCSGVDLQ